MHGQNHIKPVMYLYLELLKTAENALLLRLLTWKFHMLKVSAWEIFCQSCW